MEGSFADCLTGEHIVIRKARMTDLDAVHANVYSDEVLLSTMFMGITKEKAASEARLRRTIKFQEDKPLYFVALKQTDEVIGVCGIREEAPGVYSETGLAIARQHQGRGYATQMLRLLLDYAFLRLDAREFVYYCMDFNERSKGLARHFGFRYQSTAAEVREYDQKEFQIERYTLSREDYLERKEA